jgi:hypothetical protein
MTNRRLTRLTNAFSQRVEMRRRSIAMTFFANNLIKKHRSLGGKTPAMAAGITDHVFTVRTRCLRQRRDGRCEGRVSAPLSFEDAVKALLATPPPTKTSGRRK